MPRIRKKTSKRGTTHERRRLQDRIKESLRKKVKTAKKNPQWKSKHKKNPGIPNNFPYKDQILAEVVEQRRLAAEEKQRRKDAKKGILADQVDVEADDESDNEPVDEERPLDDDKDGDIQGVGSISAKRIASSRVSGQVVATEDDEEDEDEEAPLLINRDLPHLQSVLDAADAIIQVLDARDPLSFRSSHLEEAAEKAGKKVLFVLNKIDTCPKEAVEAWARVLGKQHPTLLFRTATSFLPENPRVPVEVKGKAKAKKPVADALGVESIQQYLQDWVKAKKGDSFTVAVVGVANVGKSSFVNSLLKKAVLPVYEARSSSRGPTTTSIPQEVTIEIEGSSIRIIDTPGFSWEWEEKDAEETSRARSHDILIRNRGRVDRLKDPSLPISEIVTRSNPEDLMLLYNLPIFSRGDVRAFLSGVARAQHLVQKRGHLDITGASRIILRDWNTGKLQWYCAPSSKDVPADSSSTGPNEAVISSLLSKKEMRRAGGLVKLTAGKIDERRLALDDTYAAMEDDSDDSEGDDDDQMEVDDDEDEDEDEDEDQEMSDGDIAAEASEEDDQNDQNEEEEEGEALASTTNHKRKRTDRVAPPSKKVAFAKARDRSLPKAAITKVSKLKAPPKSAMKNLNSVPPKKATANVSSKTRPKMTTSTDDGEAYDFGKYF